jgi:hypothetical protein
VCVQNQAATSASNALNAVKDSDIAKTLESLSETERDAAMKYVYRAMDLGLNCNKMLLWHEKLHEKVSERE